MGEAIGVGFDLGALSGLYTAVGLLRLVLWTFVLLAGALDVSIGGLHPLRGIAHAIEGTIVRGLNRAIHALEKRAARFEHGMIESLMLLLGTTLLLGLAIKAAFVKLWDSLLRPLIHSITDPIHDLADEALTKARALETTIQNDVVRLEHTITRDVSAALHEAESFAASRVAVAERDFTIGIDRLDSKLTTALHDTAHGIEAGVSDALDALRRGEAAAIDAVTTAEGATAEALRDLIGKIPLTDIAGIIAAVPLLQALVQTLEAETGLNNAECRGKVKQICGTDPGAWAALLEGLIGGIVLMNFRTLARFTFDIGKELHDDVAGYFHESKAA